MSDKKKITTLETLVKVKNHEIEGYHYQLRDLFEKRLQTVEQLNSTQQKYLGGIAIANEARASCNSPVFVWDSLSGKLKDKWISLHHCIAEIDVEIKQKQDIIIGLKKNIRQIEKRRDHAKEVYQKDMQKKEEAFISDLYAAKSRRL